MKAFIHDEHRLVGHDSIDQLPRGPDRSEGRCQKSIAEQHRRVLVLVGIVGNGFHPFVDGAKSIQRQRPGVRAAGYGMHVRIDEPRQQQTAADVMALRVLPRQVFGAGRVTDIDDFVAFDCHRFGPGHRLVHRVDARIRKNDVRCVLRRRLVGACGKQQHTDDDQRDPARHSNEARHYVLSVSSSLRESRKSMADSK